MSEIKQKGLEAKLFEGTWTVEVQEPMLGISVGTHDYGVNEIEQIYVLPAGITTIVPRDTNVDEFMEGIYAAANRTNAESIYNAVKSEDMQNPDILLDRLNQEYEKVTMTEEQLYDILGAQDNLYRVPEAEAQPGLVSRMKDYVLPNDDVTRLLGATIVGASLLIGGLIAYDYNNRQQVQEEPVTVDPVKVDPVKIEPVTYETCEAAREAYKSSKDVVDRRAIRKQIKTLCK